jgi:hypothetical protein
MKKIALFVALAMIAASPAMAQQKKKGAAAPAMTPEQQHFDNSYRLVRDGLPIFLPSWAQFIYQTGVKPAMETSEPPTPAKKKSKKKS